MHDGDHGAHPLGLCGSLKSARAERGVGMVHAMNCAARPSVRPACLFPCRRLSGWSGTAGQRESGRRPTDDMFGRSPSHPSSSRRAGKLSLVGHSATSVCLVQRKPLEQRISQPTREGRAALDDFAELSVLGRDFFSFSFFSCSVLLPLQFGKAIKERARERDTEGIKCSVFA